MVLPSNTAGGRVKRLRPINYVESAQIAPSTTWHRPRRRRRARSVLGQGAELYVAQLDWSFEGDCAPDRRRAQRRDGPTTRAAQRERPGRRGNRIVRSAGLKTPPAASGASSRPVPAPRQVDGDGAPGASARLSAQSKRPTRPSIPAGSGPAHKIKQPSQRVAKIPDDAPRRRVVSVIQPLEQTFVRLLAPLMSRDDEGAPEDAVVPTFEKKMVAESFPGVDIKALFDRASEQSFDVAPAPMETDVTLDAAAAKSWQNALRALIDVVSQVAPHIANKTGDPLQELFKHMCEASAFQQYLGAPRVAPDGEQLPALELTVEALMAANNDPQKRCFAGGHNANVVKKHADNLAKALRLLVNALQKGGGLVDTDSWLDNVRRSTANLKDDRTGNKVAIRFATVFPKALNTWPACLQHLLAVVDKHAASSVHEVSKRFKHMGPPSRSPASRPAPTSTSPTGRSGQDIARSRAANLRLGEPQPDAAGLHRHAARPTARNGRPSAPDVRRVPGQSLHVLDLPRLPLLCARTPSPTVCCRAASPDRSRRNRRARPGALQPTTARFGPR